MEKTLKIAGVPMKIKTMYDSLSDVSDEYNTQEEPLIFVETNGQDIVYERKKCLEEAAYEGLPCPAYSDSELENTAVYRKIADNMPNYDAIVFHGSAVAVGKKAVLFTAKSGTGKTTHTNLWLKNIEGSFVVNGDKPILRIIDGTVYVCGTPWMGKEGLGCNKLIPLAAICILNRAKENSIKEIDFSYAFPSMFGASYRPPNSDLMVKTAKLVEKIGKSIKLYELFCNMQDEAAKIAYEGMLL